MFTAGSSDFLLFTLILMRVSGFVFMNPVYGKKGIPSIAKTGITLVMTILLYSMQPEIADQVVQSSFLYGVMLIKEFFVGYISGFIMYLFEYGIIYAGAIMDFQMGLAMATVYDPGSGMQTPLSGRILQIYYMLLFFAVDGHLAVMGIVAKSVEIIPFGSVVISQDALMIIPDVFSRTVLLAVKLSFPFIAIEFIVEVAIGILMKMIPQINLFILSIQMKIVTGLVMLILLVSPIGDFLNKTIDEMFETTIDALYLMSG